MALSKEVRTYFTDSLGSPFAADELVTCFTSHDPLSKDTTDRLYDAFTNPFIADKFIECVRGTHRLTLREAEFTKTAFSAPVNVLQSIFANLAGGVDPFVNTNRI